MALQDCGESKDDVVVKTDDQAALLPMSGYEKPQDANVNGMSPSFQDLVLS